jgi:2-polyprenyl-6-methoxyphenol hydroxylase-like FAD-dependent oxidoreductase
MAGIEYDTIIVGARCAGAPTAMLLARRGYSVLLVDRATFPSDTISTHMIHPPGIAALNRWGLLDDLLATGCPPIHTYVFDFGPFIISGAPGIPEAPLAYAPRRTVLDKLLVDAAADAGAEVREGFSVEALVFEEGRVVGIRGRSKEGHDVTERARVVVGADGRNSRVAQAVKAERYHEKPRLLSAYYSYWSNVPNDGRFEVYVRPDRGFAAWPTNDGLTLIVGGWPFAEFEANKRDVEGNFLKMLDLAPSLADRVRAGTREAHFVGASIRNFFHKPYGEGWALVGDAGYNKDFITAMGIQDAFRDAELCATSLNQAFSGRRPYDYAMRDYQVTRDEHVMAMYEFTTQLATLEPPPPELQQLLGAVSRNQEAMDAFARVNAGVTSPSEFFSEENVGNILATAGSGSMNPRQESEVQPATVKAG